MGAVYVENGCHSKLVSAYQCLTQLPPSTNHLSMPPCMCVDCSLLACLARWARTNKCVAYQFDIILAVVNTVVLMI